MRCGVVGYGVVGKAVAQFLEANGLHVEVYDSAFHDLSARELVNGCDVAFICVPTPMAPDGRCDTSAIEEVVGWCRAGILVIRSTVAVGTTDRLRAETGKRIVFQPEFLGETPWSSKSAHTNFIVLGGAREDTKPIVRMYQAILGPGAIYREVSAATAEMMKYTINTFLALKVAFFNEIHDIAGLVGVDYDELRELVLLDERLLPNHTMVTEERGFGGKCLPKDLSALIFRAGQLGYEPLVLQAVWASNERVRASAGRPRPVRRRRVEPDRER
jgi:UDPglucose 6-dehydrogenase